MGITCSVCANNFQVSAPQANKPHCCPRCHHITRASINRSRGAIGLHPILAEKYQNRLLDKKQTRSIDSHQLISPFMDEARKIIIPGYQVMECVGRGAMGSVYKALRDVDGREVAIKVLSEKMADNPDLVARFEREATALRTFRHDNVVAIVDSGIHDGIHYLCMEYVHGTTLRRVLRDQPPNLRKSIVFVRSILAGLGAAHKRGVIHRDLKPENVLLQGGPGLPGHVLERIVLVDFGLAGIIDDAMDPHPHLTKSRMTMGTVNYMAPEQNLDAKRVDHRCDIYSCGVILYECLLGDLPQGRYRLPSERGISAPPSLDQCILKSLSQRPDDRFANAYEFDKVLFGILGEIDREQSKLTNAPAEQAINNQESFSSTTNHNSKANTTTMIITLSILVAGIVFGLMFATRSPSKNVSGGTALFSYPDPVYSPIQLRDGLYA